LEAFSKLDPNSRSATVAGDGPLKAEMQESGSHARNCRTRRIPGAEVPWPEMKRQYQEADLFLFTSLRDSSGQVLAEAMASGLPIVALDHQGVGAIVLRPE
jgi:glycosyltransferase involved in cell wall biosynthesis